MKIFRKAIFWIHLCCGVLGAIVIFIMCVTGAALSFEKNIIESVEYGERFVAADGQRLTALDILTKVAAAKPNAKPSSIAMSSNPAAAVTVNMGRDGQVFVDPYTGNITGEGNKSVRSFFGFMTDLHRWIALSGDGRAVGRAITGACNLMFLFLAISGIYIWLPGRLSWKHIRPNIMFRSTGSGKARDFNWHNTIGFWTSLVLIVLTLTAAVISYQWAANLIYTLTGNEVPQQQPAPPPAAPQAEQPFVVPANLNALWTAAGSHTTGWKTISLRLPVGKDAVFSIDEAKSLNIFGRSALTLDAATAAVSKWEPYAEQNSARQIRTWSRFTHTGESLGIVGQIIGFFACVGGAVLVYTGMALSVRRLSAFIRRRSSRSVVS